MGAVEPGERAASDGAAGYAVEPDCVPGKANVCWSECTRLVLNDIAERFCAASAGAHWSTVYAMMYSYETPVAMVRKPM